MHWRSAFQSAPFVSKSIPPWRGSISGEACSVIVPFSDVSYHDKLQRLLGSIRDQQTLQGVRVDMVLMWLAEESSPGTEADEEKLLKLADEFGARLFKGVKKYSHFPLCCARNAGAAQARTNRLIFVDADMVLDPEALCRTLAVSNNHAVAIYTADLAKGVVCNKVGDVRKVVQGQRVGAGCYGGYLCVPRKAFDEVGGYDEAYDGAWGAEDADFVDRGVEWGRTSGLGLANLSVEAGIVNAHPWHEAKDCIGDGTYANRVTYAQVSMIVVKNSKIEVKLLTSLVQRTSAQVELQEEPRSGISFIVHASSEKYCERLQRCLKSIRSQVGVCQDDIEIILAVVPKVSENIDLDALKDIAAPFNTRVIYYPVDVPAYSSSIGRNVGARFARKGLLCIVDADTVLDVELLKLALDMLGAPAARRFVVGMTAYLEQQECEALYAVSGVEEFRRIVAGRRIMGGGDGGFVLVRCEDFEAINGYDEDFVGYGCQDNDFVNRLSHFGRTRVVLNDSVVRVAHQWHPRREWDIGELYSENRKRFFGTERPIKTVNKYSANVLPSHEVTRVYRSGTTKPRVLCISDVIGWAFDQNLHDLEEYLRDKFDFEHWYVAEWHCGRMPIPDMAQFDVIFCPFHMWGIEHLLPLDRTVGSLRSSWMFPNNRRAPQQEEFAVVSRFRAFHFVNKRNYNEYKDSCHNAVYLTNPVNMHRFPKPTKIRGCVVASWNGNAGHSDGCGTEVKGFRTILLPTCSTTGIDFKYAEYTTCRRLPVEMPGFYLQSNVALCASLYEGGSSSVMEAMASGLALVATDVGNHREMHESMLARCGDSGIMLVERNIGAFVEALEKLKRDPDRIVEMGRLNREEIMLNWSWDAWKDRFVEFLMMALEER